MRIGIHTGQVVVGGMGSGDHPEQLALGETPNISARVQGEAQPDEVLISTATSRLVEGLFETKDQGHHELKGISTPQSLYLVMAEKAVRSRFEAAVQGGLNPLVGRDNEVQFLQQRWEQVQAGEGQAVTIIGEAGIGKSRLIQEFKEKVVQASVRWIEFRCSPYHQNSVLYPVIEYLLLQLQFQRVDTDATKLAKLCQTLAAYQFPQDDTVPLVAALLSLPHPKDYPALAFSPQKQKEKTYEILLQWLSEEAQQAGLCAIWEDLHWADPSTLELLTLYLEHLPTSRVLVLCVSRPEFTPPWGTRSYVSQLTLSRLEREQVEGIVECVTKGRALPVEVVAQVIAKTDGVPLFVEELTKMVVESGVVRPVNSHYELTGPLSALAIPASLHDSLMARLDRLAAAKDVAQLGATIGREFSAELIEAISPWDSETLQQGLRQLVEAELVYRSGLGEQTRFVFKHALVQDTAYQSLLKSTRRRYHQQIAHVLEERFPSTLETQPELVAHHLTEAELGERAIPYWQQAGQRASIRSANVEAAGHLTQALDLLRALPDVTERASQELELQTALGPVLMATKGYGTSEVERIYTRARELCQQVGETPQLLPVLWGLLCFYSMKGEAQTASEFADQLVRLAQRVQDPAFLVLAHRVRGVDTFWLGELVESFKHSEQAITLYDRQLHHAQAFFTVSDSGVHCQGYAAGALWYLGYPDQAVERTDQAVALAQELSHSNSLVDALNWAVVVHLLRRDMQAVQEKVAALISLCTDTQVPFFLATGTIVRGWILVEQGQTQEGLAQIHQGLAAKRAVGAGMEETYWLTVLAQAYARNGQIEEGLRIIAEARDVMSERKAYIVEAELYRLKGELTLQQFKVQSSRFKVEEEAEICFQRAIAVAQQQQAKSWELCATTSLVRLWQKQGKHEEAHKLLAEIFNWFTEGFDTKDLQEAKDLLEELV